MAIPSDSMLINLARMKAGEAGYNLAGSNAEVQRSTFYAIISFARPSFGDVVVVKYQSSNGRFTVVG